MSEDRYRNAFAEVQKDSQRLMEQNKRYREALVEIINGNHTEEEAGNGVDEP